MQWIAPSGKDTHTVALERRLWDAADQFRADSGLKSQEYSAPVPGLIVLRFAEVRFANHRAKLDKSDASSRRASRADEPAAHNAEGILDLPGQARFDFPLGLPEAENIGAKVNAAMRDIEQHNPQLAGVLANLTLNPVGRGTVEQERLKDMVTRAPRFPFGLPRTDNATALRASAQTPLARPHRRSVGAAELHYLWMQLFHSAPNEKGCAEPHEPTHVAHETTALRVLGPR